MQSRTEGMWWGTAIEAPDPAALARFYSELVGWPLVHEEPGTAVLATARDGSVFMVFQQATDYVRSGVAAAGRPAAADDAPRPPGRRPRLGRGGSGLARGNACDAPAAGQRPRDARPGRPPVLPLPRRRLTTAGAGTPRPSSSPGRAGDTLRTPHHGGGPSCRHQRDGTCSQMVRSASGTAPRGPTSSGHRCRATPPRPPARWAPSVDETQALDVEHTQAIPAAAAPEQPTQPGYHPPVPAQTDQGYAYPQPGYPQPATQQDRLPAGRATRRPATAPPAASRTPRRRARATPWPRAA